MSPIDDELRAALRGRADTVSPAADPLGGIESRARGLRRRRTAAAVAGAALAVAAVAIAVPTLAGSDRADDPGRFTTQAPSDSTSSALDPARPWAFRGTLSAGARQRLVDAFVRAYPGSTLTPLFGQTYEPSGREEMAFVASGGPSGDIVGWATDAADGPSFDVRPYPERLTALPFVLPGDEVQRLFVVAAPGSSFTVSNVRYEPASGVMVTSLAARVEYWVLDSSGRQQYHGTAEPTSAESQPANVLSWVVRGNSGLVDGTAVRTAYAQAVGQPVDGVVYRALYTGNTDSGVRFTVGQAWSRGDALAHTFGYATGGTNGPQVFLGPETPAKAELVALLVDSLPGTTTDLLVLVPRPGTGQLSYSPDATAAFRAVASGRSDLEGIGFVDRSTTATNDRVEQLDGDGNLDHPIYRGPVAPYLCGDKECG